MNPVSDGSRFHPRNHGKHQICQHGREHDAEEDWGKNTSLFHAFSHWEAKDHWLISDVQYFHYNAVMKLSDDCNELASTAKRLHDLSADRIEGLGQVDEGHEEVAVSLLAFFL